MDLQTVIPTRQARREHWSQREVRVNHLILFRSVACSSGGRSNLVLWDEQQEPLIISIRPCGLRSGTKDPPTSLYQESPTQSLSTRSDQPYDFTTQHCHLQVYRVHSVMEFTKNKRWKIICVLNYFAISCWATFTAILGYR